jgi:hypothetical protein
MEAITSRPLLLHAIATRIRHARQTALKIASSHAKAIPATKAIHWVIIFLRDLAKNAEQLTARIAVARRWIDAPRENLCALIEATRRHIQSVAGMSQGFEGLSAYEKRLWVEIDRILYQNYLTPRMVTDFWQGDRDAIIVQLKQMKERVVRIIVLSEYVEIDDMLGRIIDRYLSLPTRSWRKQRIVSAMLDKPYPQQKLDIIRTYRTVPRSIANHLLAMNDLRNTLTHRFDLSRVPKSKRLYKGRFGLFTKAGLERFRADMWEVQEFFQPRIVQRSLRLVAAQRISRKRN